MDTDQIVLLLDSISQLQTFTRIVVATLALGVYDIALNMHREVQHIWRSKWSWPKCLYLFVRYWPIASLIFYLVGWSPGSRSTKTCQGILFFTVVAGSPNANLLPVDIILYLRLSALYSHNKRVMYPILAIVTLSSLVEIAALFPVLYYPGDALQPVPPGVPITPCLTNLPRSRQFPLLIVSSVSTFIVSGTLFTALIAYIIVETRRREQVGLREGITNMPPLLYSCFRDGAGYFFLVEAVTLAAIIQIIARSEGLIQIAYVPFVIVTASVAGSRLILELREAALKNVPGMADAPMSVLDFGGFEMATRVSAPNATGGHGDTLNGTHSATLSVPASGSHTGTEGENTASMIRAGGTTEGFK